MTLSTKTLRYSASVLLALGAGYIGSAVQMRWCHRIQSGEVRATRFELMDNAGRVVALWATAQGSGAVLAFADVKGMRLCELGIGGRNGPPFLRLYGKDGKERVTAVLGYDDDPVLLLSDAHRARAVLGASHSDAPGPSDDQWGLYLRGREADASASIGFFRWWDNTYHAGVRLSDGPGRVWEAEAGTSLRPIPVHRRQGH